MLKIPHSQIPILIDNYQLVCFSRCLGDFLQRDTMKAKLLLLLMFFTFFSPLNAHENDGENGPSSH